jgi:RNA polymerase sigma factor (sigma-70 family)
MSNPLLRTNKEISELYERHVKTVYRVCFTYLKNPIDTEDIVQDTFIKLIHHQSQFMDFEHEKAWLIVTAANLCKNHLRHWWRNRANLDDYANLSDGETPVEIDETFKIVMSLPDKYKTTIYLYYYEGYKSVEIAKLLKKKEATIRGYLHTGRQLLRTKLGGEVNE